MLLSLILLACRGTPTATDVPVPTLPPVTCDDAPWLGPEEGTGSLEEVFTFTYDSALGISVGPVVTVRLRPAVAGLGATVDAPGRDVALNLFELDGEAWIDGSTTGEGAWDTAPYYHWGVLGGAVVAPIDPTTLPDGATCLRVQPAALDDLTGEAGVLWLSARNALVPDARFIDLNLVRVGDTAISDAELEVAIRAAGAVWTGGGGPAVGDTPIHQVPGSAFVAYDDSNVLRATVVDATRPFAMNVFFIQDYADAAGTLGEAGGIPGAVGVQGVDGAGVIVAVDGHLRVDGTLDVELLGETLAHEIGHQFGLFHTTEEDGSRLESLTDTPACPASADDGDGYYTAEECAAFDGGNFMFWVAGDLDQTAVSAQQAQVLSRSVMAR